jgi:hypothetical protein
MTQPFWVDADYDRDKASDGDSRFGVYVRRHTADLTDTLDCSGPSRFAAACWRIANPPTMLPGYVRAHKRIMHTRVGYNAWDGSLSGHVSIVTPRPARLQDLAWMGWPVESAWGGHEWFREPGEEELTRSRYLMPSTLLAFPVPTRHLVKPRGEEDFPHLAQDTISVLVSELNMLVTPVLDALERS